MVKARSRSKISPGAKIDALRRSATIIKSDQELNAKVGLFAKNRFNQPSTARSLPSLALNANEKREITRSSVSKIQVTRPEKKASPAKKSTSVSKLTKKPVNQKSVDETSAEINLDNISESTLSAENTLQLPLVAQRLMNGVVSPSPSDSENSTPEHVAKSEKGDSDRFASSLCQ